MLDRFRDLERAGVSGKKDSALLAAVAGYEAVQRPADREKAQFTRLFVALFEFASDEARRTASAALSRLPDVPHDVAMAIVRAPLEISAPFLAFGLSLQDDVLVELAATLELPKVKAIARRSFLSTSVEDALRSRFRQETAPSGTEERVRMELKALVSRPLRASELALPEPTAAPVAVDALVEAAALGDRARFSNALADRLHSTATLAERILMDASGRQLAMTLQALGLGDAQIIATLEAVFSHLQTVEDGESQAAVLLADCDPEISRRKVTAWRNANPPLRDNRARHARQVMETGDRPLPTTERRHAAPASGTAPAADKTFSRA